MKTYLKPILVITIIISLLLTGGIAFFFLNNSRDDTTSVESIIPGSEPPYNFNYSWAENNPYIAHAFGGILGKSYTNSYEAFLLNYQLGHRVFEVDFYITNDGYTVAAHDNESWARMVTHYETGDVINTNSAAPDDFTYANFKSSLWYDQFHPVDLDQLFSILQKYPDTYIVTDTKFTDEANVKKQFTAFVEAARKIDTRLLDRFIIQIYHPEMLDWIMEIYPWKSIIYTLYQSPDWTPENVVEFSKKSGVRFITMWGHIVNQETSSLWHENNIKIAAHTINNISSVNQLRALGADLFYTDFLIP